MHRRGTEHSRIWNFVRRMAEAVLQTAFSSPRACTSRHSPYSSGLLFLYCRRMPERAAVLVRIPACGSSTSPGLPTTLPGAAAVNSSTSAGPPHHRSRDSRRIPNDRPARQQCEGYEAHAARKPPVLARYCRAQVRSTVKMRRRNRRFFARRYPSSDLAQKSCRAGGRFPRGAAAGDQHMTGRLSHDSISDGRHGRCVEGRLSRRRHD